jgi:hypothetical protein
MLLEYLKNVQPEFMERFVKRAPKQVQDFLCCLANQIDLMQNSQQDV